MKTESSSQNGANHIVEIIDDENDAPNFSDLASSFSNGVATRRSRWVGPGIAVVLLAVVGYAVVSSAVTSSPPTPSTPGSIKSQYFVADMPRSGFVMYLAEARGEAGTNSADFAPATPAELWATPDATATSGSWFVISLGPQHATGRNSYRTVVDGTAVIVEHDPASGQSRLSFTKNGQEMAITAFGWVDRQLLRLVRAASVNDSKVSFSDNFFTSDHQRILDVDPAKALFGQPVARVGYTTGLPTSLASYFTVTVGGDTGLDRARVDEFALTNIRTFPVGDLATTVTAIVGKSAADPSISVVQWHDAQRLITISGNLDGLTLQSIAQTVHESPSTTVHEQLQAGGVASPVLALEVDPRIVVSGGLADGSSWTIGVSPRDPVDQSAGYLWWIGQPGETTHPSETWPALPGSAPSIDTFVEHGRTYVLATVPRSMAGAQLHVNPTGLPSLVSTFGDVDGGYADLFDASVFFQPVTFTAEIIDRNGTSVAFWPPT